MIQHTHVFCGVFFTFKICDNGFQYCFDKKYIIIYYYNSKMLPKLRRFSALILFTTLCLFVYIFLDNSSPQEYLHQNFFGPTISRKNKYEVYNQDKPYLVNTTKCQIPYLKPFDDEVVFLYENKSGQQIECKNKPEFEISIKRYNYTGIQIEYNSNAEIECYSSGINRSLKNDDDIHYSPNVEFKNSVQYFPNEHAVRITCMINKGHKGYEKVIPLIPEIRPKAPQNSELPNILFIGLDSISRVNFDRHFPITAKLLSKHKFYTMYGYNKVADNTFVNLTPLLTGLYLEDLWNETMSKDIFLNYFPFIWKDYEKKGYHTLLMEDAPEIATFNYLKPGFLESPTNYYLRPFSLAIKGFVSDNCYLSQPEIEVYYQYIYDFIKSMDIRKQHYFGFTFMARLTHDHLNSAGYADHYIAKLFNQLFDENLMSNTILVFFSDHGIRFGPIRETLSGKIEERMPFMHLYLPNKWRNRYIQINENRLTTPFDIHATLQHIIRGDSNPYLRYGKSLLEEIPEYRTCKSIPILDHWCSCQISQQLTNLTAVKPMAKFIVKKINQLLSEKYSQKCAKLVLNQILTAYKLHLSDKVLQFRDSLNDVIGRHVIFSKTKFRESFTHYLVTINVKPSDAVFESTVKLNEFSGEMSLIGDISRINLYGNQSVCIDNQFIRKYCFCKN